MEKLYSLVQKTPTPQKLALGVMILLVLGGGHYWFIYTSQAEELQKLSRQLQTLEEELHEKEEIAGNLTKFKQRVEYLQQKLEEKKKNLPDDANIDHLLKTLNELSEKSDIRIIKFSPASEVRKNFYAEIPVKMEIEGNYHEITTFFDKIAKEERIINVSDIGMSEPAVRSGKVVLQAQCMAKTFRAVKSPNVAAPGGKVKKKPGAKGK